MTNFEQVLATTLNQNDLLHSQLEAKAQESLRQNRILAEKQHLIDLQSKQLRELSQKLNQMSRSQAGDEQQQVQQMLHVHEIMRQQAPQLIGSSMSAESTEKTSTPLAVDVDQLMMAQQKIVEQQRAIERLRQELNQLNDQYSQQHTAIDRLLAQNDVLKQNEQHLQQQVASLRSQEQSQSELLIAQQTRSQEFEQLNVLYEALQQRNVQQEQQISNLQKQVVELREAKKEGSQAFQALKQTYEELSVQLENERLKAEDFEEAMKNERGIIISQLLVFGNYAEQKDEEIRDKLEAVQKRAGKEVLEKVVTAAAHQMKTQTELLDEFTQVSLSQISKEEGITKENNALKQEVADLSQALLLCKNTNTEMFAKMNKEKMELQQAFDNYRVQALQLEILIEQQKATNNALQIDNEQLNNSIAEQSSKFEQIIANNNLENNAHQQKFADVMKQKEALEHKLRTSLEENNMLKQQLDQEHAKSQVNADAIISAKTAIQNYAQNEAAAKQKIQALELSVTQKVKQFEEVQESKDAIVKQLTASIQQVEKQLQASRVQFEQSNLQVSQLESSLNEAQTQKDELINDMRLSLQVNQDNVQIPKNKYEDLIRSKQELFNQHQLLKIESGKTISQQQTQIQQLVSEQDRQHEQEAQITNQILELESMVKRLENEAVEQAKILANVESDRNQIINSARAENEKLDAELEQRIAQIDELLNQLKMYQQDQDNVKQQVTFANEKWANLAKDKQATEDHCNKLLIAAQAQIVAEQQQNTRVNAAKAELTTRIDFLQQQLQNKDQSAVVQQLQTHIEELQASVVNISEQREKELQNHQNEILQFKQQLEQSTSNYQQVSVQFKLLQQQQQATVLEQNASVTAAKLTQEESMKQKIELSQLKSEIQKLQTEHQNILGQLQKSNTQNSQLTVQLNDEKRNQFDYTQATQEIQQLKIQLNDNQVNLRLSEENCQLQLQKQKEQFNTEIQLLKQQLQTAMSNAQTYADQVQRIQQLIDQKLSDQGQVSKQMLIQKALENENAQLKLEHEGVSAQIQALQFERQNVLVQLQNKQNEITELKQQLDTSKQQLQQALELQKQSLLNQTEQNKVNIQQLFRTKDLEIARLQKELEDIGALVKMYSVDYQSQQAVQNEISDLRKQLGEKQQMYDQKVIAMQETNIKVREAERAVAVLKQTLSQKEQDLQGQHENEVLKCKNIVDENLRLEQMRLKQDAEIQHNLLEIAGLKQEIQGSKQQISRQSADIQLKEQLLKDSAQKIDEKNQSTMQQINANSAEKLQLQQVIEQLQEQLKNYQQQRRQSVAQQEDISNKNNIITSLNLSLKELQNKLEISQKKLDQGAEQLKSIQTEITQSDALVVQQQNNISSLTHSNEALQKTLEQQSAILNSFKVNEQKIGQQRIEILNLQHQLELSNNAKIDALQQNDLLQEQLNDLARKNNELRYKTSTQSSLVNRSFQTSQCDSPFKLQESKEREEQQQLKTTNFRLSQQLAVAQLEQISCHQLIQEHEYLQTKFSQLQAENSQTSQLLQQMATDLQQYREADQQQQGELFKLQSDVEQCQNAKNAANEEAVQLRQQLMEFELQLEQYKDSTQRQMFQKEQYVQSSIEASKQSYRALDVAKQQVETELMQLKEQAQKQKLIASEVQKQSVFQVQLLEDQLSGLKQDIKEQQNIVDQIRKENKQLQNQIVKLRNIEQEYNAQQQQNADTQHQYEVLKQQNQQIILQNETLKKQSLELKQNSDKLQQNIISLQRDMQNTQIAKSNLEKQMNIQNDEVQQLKLENQELQKNKALILTTQQQNYQERQKLQQRIDQQIFDMNSLENQLKQQQSANKELQLKFDAEKLQNRNQQQQIQNMEVQKLETQQKQAEYLKQKADQEQKVNEMAQQIEEHDSEIENLKDQLDTSQRLSDQYRAKLRLKDQLIDELQISFNQSVQKNEQYVIESKTTLSTKIKQYQVQIDELSNQLQNESRNQKSTEQHLYQIEMEYKQKQDQYDASINEKDNEIQKLQATIEQQQIQLGTEQTNHRNDNQQQDQVIKQLQSENQRSKQNMQSQNNEILQMQQEIEKLKNNLQICNTKDATIEKLQQRINFLELETHQLEGQCSQISSDNVACEQQNKNLQKIIIERDNQLSQLQHDLFESQADLKRKNDAVKLLESQREGLARELSVTQNSLDQVGLDLEAQASNSKKSIQVQQQQMQQQQQQIALLESDLMSVNQQHTKAQDKLRQEAKGRQKQADQRIQQLEAENEQQKQHLLAEVSALRVKMVEAAKTRESETQMQLNASIQQRDQAISELKQNNQTLKQQITTLQTNNANCQAQNEHLQNDLLTATNRVSQLQRENEQQKQHLMSQISALQRELEVADDGEQTDQNQLNNQVIEDHKQQVQVLNQQVNKLQQNENDCQKQCQQLQNDLRTATQKISQLERDRVNLSLDDAQPNICETSLAAANAQISDLQKQLERYRQIEADLTRQLQQQPQKDDTRDGLMERLVQKINTVERSIAQRRFTADPLESTNNGLKLSLVEADELQKSRAENETLQQTVQKLIVSIQQKNELIEEFGQQMRGLEQQITTMQKVIEALKVGGQPQQQLNEVDKLQQQLKEEQEQRRSFRRRAREEMNLRVQLEAEARHYQARLEKQEDTLKRYKEDVAQIRAYAMEYVEMVARELDGK